MSLLRDHPYAAGLGLVLVGIFFVLSFNLLMGSFDDPTYAAEAFDPDEDPERLALAPNVTHITDENLPDGHADALEQARETGEFVGELDGNPAPFDHPELDYLVVEDDVYAYEASVDGEQIRFTLERADPVVVANEVSTPLDEASPWAKEAVGTGEEVTGEMGSVDIVEDDGQFYAVEVTNFGASVGGILLAPVTVLLTSVGSAFIVAGAWVTRLAVGGRLRSITPRAATGIAAAAGGHTLVSYRLFSSDTDLLLLISGVALGVAAGLLVLAGVLLAQGSQRKLAGLLVAVPVAFILGSAPLYVLFGLPAVFATVLLLVGLVLVGLFASPLVCYGYRFASTV